MHGHLLVHFQPAFITVHAVCFQDAAWQTMTLQSYIAHMNQTNTCTLLWDNTMYYSTWMDLRIQCVISESRVIIFCLLAIFMINVLRLALIIYYYHSMSCEYLHIGYMMKWRFIHRFIPPRKPVYRCLEHEARRCLFRFPRWYKSPYKSIVSSYKVFILYFSFCVPFNDWKVL